MATITLRGGAIGMVLGGGAFTNIGINFKKAINSTSGTVASLGSLSNKIDLAQVATDVSSESNCTNKVKQRENNKKNALTFAYGKLDAFISNVGKVDLLVANKIRELKNNFYSKYSYLKPDSEKNGWEKFCDGVCLVANAIKDGAIALGNWVKEHWKELLVGVIFIVVGALITVFTAGAGTAFWAAFGAALLKGFAVAAITGAVTGAVYGGATFIGAVSMGYSLEFAATNALSAFGDGFASGFLSGSIGFFGGALANGLSSASFCSNIGSKLSNIPKIGSKLGKAVSDFKVSYKVYKGVQYVNKGLDYTSKAMNIFEKAGKLSNAIFPGNDFGKFYKNVSSSTPYKIFNKSISYTSTFVGAASKKMAINDRSYLDANGNLRKNVNFVTKSKHGFEHEYWTTGKDGKIKSKTVITDFNKGINKNTYKFNYKYSNNQKFIKNIEFNRDIYKFDFKKQAKKFGEKLFDVYTGNNKYLTKTAS